MAEGVPASASYTPGLHTAATLRRRVLNYISAPDDSELQGVAMDSLNSAIAMCNARKWHKQITQTDITLVASTAAYGVPNDFKEPHGLYRINSSDKRTRRIPYKPIQTLLAEWENSTVDGTPSAYGVDYVARQIRFDVVPGTAFVANTPEVRLWYHRRVPELIAPSETIALAPEFEWYIIWAARAELTAARDTKKFGIAEAKAAQYWRELIRNDTDQMTDFALPVGYYT